MSKKEIHYLYALTFDANPNPVVFYIGHTNNPKRRETEHRSCARDLTNTEYKYQWCRELEQIGIDWQFVIIGEIEDDDDAEYEWVLKFARDNKSKGITFINDLPLTNMKAGDFLGEILDRKDIRTKEHIKQYRKERKESTVTSYNRDDPGWDTSWNYVPTERGEQFQEYAKELGKEYADRTEQKKRRSPRIVQDLNSTARQHVIEQDTVRLIGQSLDTGDNLSKDEITDMLKLMGGFVRTMETTSRVGLPGGPTELEHQANIAAGYARIQQLQDMLGETK